MTKLALLILILAIIFLVASADSLVQCRRGPHVLIVTDDDNELCHSCYKCPAGKGMSIKCAGQIVKTTVNIECMDCVHGVNYSSTNDYRQCLDCPKICNNEEIKGECEPDGDNRECIPCKDGWYFDEVREKCLRCSCHNISAEAMQKCSRDGFSIEQCRKVATNSSSNSEQVHEGNGRAGWKTVYIIPLICGCIVFILLLICLCCVGNKVCKFKEINSRWPHPEEWKFILCFLTKSESPAATNGDGVIPVNTGIDFDAPTSQPSFNRQSSCPVTDNEVEVATKSTKRLKIADYFWKKCSTIKELGSQEKIALVTNTQKECSREGLKVDQLNSEVCRRMYNLLNGHTYNDTGIGYTTLAGLMDYSGEKVREFESTGNAAKGLVIFWSKTESNNVLKFIKLLKCLGRDDIVNILENELPDCECGRCLLV